MTEKQVITKADKALLKALKRFQLKYADTRYHLTVTFTSMRMTSGAEKMFIKFLCEAAKGAAKYAEKLAREKREKKISKRTMRKVLEEE